MFLRQLSDLQTFEGALGGARASPIISSGDPERPFMVEGDTFDRFESAGERSCDRQFQGCQDSANSGGGGKGVTVRECEGQKCEFFSLSFSTWVEKLVGVDDVVLTKNSYV